MRFGTRRSDEPELNLVPMIDVLLMTLIFLVMTTTFSKEVQLSIRLPESSAETKVEETPLRITIDAQGQYFVNDTQLLNNSPEVKIASCVQPCVKLTKCSGVSNLSRAHYSGNRYLQT